MEQRKFVNDFYSVWSRGTSLYVSWATKHGISYTTLSILYALMNYESTTQREICEFYGLPKQTVNNCIRQLESNKYVQLVTNAKDKREKNIVFTKSGRDFANDTLTPLFKIEEAICRNIASKDFIQAIETRELFNTLFEKEMEKEI